MQSEKAAALFAPFARKMEAEGLHPLQVESFRRHFHRLASGEGATLAEADLEPVEDLPRLEDLPAPDEADFPDHVAALNLNGGLGTSMGLTGPKSLLRVKGGLTFLDVLARHVLHERQRRGSRLPLVLMNSFNTSAETRKALEAYPTLGDQAVPLELVQSQVPKILAEGLRPAEWPDHPRLEWCPPGHGDVYLSLHVSGLLDGLREAGFRYLFLSNVDNLGATVDLRLPAYMAAERVPFLMEVASRSAADRKGGHLARLRRDRRLVLRESAQCPPDEEDRFQDVRRHRYFNTNNLWVDLEALRARLDEEGGVLPLPLIVNAKTVDPRNPASPAVLQLETAMGSAISVFPEARAVLVPRTRFTPVKTTDDLLAVQSDAFVLTEGFHIRLHPERTAPPVVRLDPEFYRLVPDLERRLPHGPPGLLRCASLTVRGDVAFGRGVAAEGEVTVVAEEPATVPDGTVLRGEVRLPA